MKISITDFQERGITDELRGASGFGMIAGLEANRRDRLMPTPDFNAGTHASSTITDLSIDTFSDVNGVMYGLGVIGSNPALFDWDENNNRWTDHVTAGFTGVAADILVPYGVYFYGAKGGTHIWRGEIDGSPAPATWQSLTYTNFAAMVHHQADDKLYFLYDNKIGSYDGSTYTAVDLTLPSVFRQTTGVDTDTYLLSGGYDTNTFKSFVYWWDRDSGLSTITAENIFDRGILKHLFRISGQPLALVLVDSTGVVQDDAKEELRVYSLSLAGYQLVNRIEATSINIGQKWSYDNRAYFALNITKDGTTFRGIAQIDELGRITMPYLVNDTSQNVYGIARSGGQVWASTTGDSNVYNTVSSYADTRYLESRIYRAQELQNKLDFKGMTITTTPLPASATLTVKWRENEAGTWQTIRTFNTQGDTIHSLVKSSSQPSKTHEKQFRIETVGNFTITGITGNLPEDKSESYD